MKAAILVGPTAVGKSAVAEYLAAKYNLPIISADSMLIYKGMDIGTAKPTQQDRQRVRYYGLDCAEPGQTFSVGDWLSAIKVATLEPESIIAGGTGLYITSLLNPLSAPPSNPQIREKYTRIYEEGGIEALTSIINSTPKAATLVPIGGEKNPRRIIRALERYEAGDTPATPPTTLPVIACLNAENDFLRKRIKERIDKMFAQGLVDEAIKIRSYSQTACKAIGYEEALLVADGKLTQDEAKEKIFYRTAHLAKRQRTYFRHKLNVRFIEVTPTSTIEELANSVEEIWNKYGRTSINI